MPPSSRGPVALSPSSPGWRPWAPSLPGNRPLAATPNCPCALSRTLRIATNPRPCPTRATQFGMLGWWDRNTGSGRYATNAWIGANVILGGAAQLYSRASSIWREPAAPRRRFVNEGPSVLFC
jgi:hypothetical protein